MKKVLSLVLVSAMLLFSVAAMADVELLIGTQETGTAGYTYATAIMQCIQTIPGYSVSLVSNSSGNVTSPVLIQEGECDITVSNSAPALWATTTGVESASLPVCPDVRCIAGGLGKDFINVMFTQSFVDKTGIKTIEELVEKQQPVRMIIKKNGSFGELAAERVFGVFGVDINNPPAWLTVEKTSGGAIKDGLSDDLYDLTIDHISAGQANTTELCLIHEMVDVQLADETLAKLCEQGYDYVTVPANTWNGQTEEIKTVGSQQCIIVSADMDEQVAYNITKALCEHRDILVNTSAVLGNFNPEVAGSKALTGCELHPGAAKYYEEMGWAHN